MIVNKDFNVSLTDMLYLLILNGIFFWMVSGIQTGNVFSVKEFSWISMHAFVLLTWMIERFFEWYIRDYFTAKISEGYYRALDLHFGNMWAICIVLFMVPFIQPFLARARQLEDDQNLTI